ncbi:Mif2/CENP-C like-domain-containing protein [Gloeopeniophorella convolvens]|nr:Mif2/CENP-C like-domain-containing protein [Gloeopeniophorella convolvens]
MPTSARKSSLGVARRAKQRPHIPFNADDLGRGKKTGLPIPTVGPGSDGFEPFDEILSQADTRPAWHGHNKPPGRKTPKRKSVAPIYEDDGGEMSMDLDDYGGPSASASAYFSNTRQPGPGFHRVGSSSRPVARGSDVDFDAVPSPRPRKSGASSARRSSLGLPNSYAPDPEDDMPFDDGGGGDLFEEDMDIEESESRSKFSVRQATPRRPGPPNIDEDESEAEEEEAASRSRLKGKAKATDEVVEEEDDNAVEEEIANGLDDVDMQPVDEEEEAEEPPPKKKAPEKKPRQKRKIAAVPLSPENTSGLRRGKRLRYEPLEWWRCEKVVYGRREAGKVSYVPTIKEIVRIPKDPPKPLGAVHKGRRGRSTAPRSKTDEQVAVFNPEEGWDNDTHTNGVVVDWFTGNEVSRRLAFPGRLVNPRPAANNEFFFTKVFGDGEYIAAGQLRIPPNKHKPSKMTKDNTYVFFVIEGAVNFKVHESSYVLCTGGMILVPRGNTYYIENIAERDAKLFFAQARRVSAEEEASPEVLPAPEREDTGTPRPRSTSIGQAPASNRPSSERAAGAKRGASKRA